ncbi:MAG: rod shape-determining protein MreC [Desulfobacterales bacterium]|nr:rod shape-determining protein MreC [Desulfobacterales bacterium]
MFSKRLVRILGVVLFVLINIVLLSISAKHTHRHTIIDRLVIAGVAPLQECVINTMRFCRNIWRHYFYLVEAREECDRIKGMIAKAEIEKSRYLESELACERLRELLEVKSEVSHRILPAQVVGLDPSGWFKTVIINKGTKEGVSKGMAVIAPGGIVGHVVGAYYRYAKVLLIIDRNSAIDALVQRTRSRGIVEGDTSENCRFKYIARKADIKIGDIVISSGLDGLFPKGLRVGAISEISVPPSGLFQEVRVRPFVDFTRLEELLVILE